MKVTVATQTKVSPTPQPKPREDILALLAKIEPPNRVLDLEISVAVNFKGMFNPLYEWRWSTFADEIEGCIGGQRKACLDPVQFVPRWTESVDAALLLVPHRMWWAMGAGRLTPNEPLYGALIFRPEDDKQVGRGEHPTSPATALCIAALQARINLAKAES